MMIKLKTLNFFFRYKNIFLGRLGDEADPQVGGLTEVKQKKY